MRRPVATALAWLIVALTAAVTPGQAQSGIEAIFSVATNQYGTAGEGATVLHEGVYDTRNGIEPFVAPFVSGFLGLNGVAVDGGSIYFSVEERGQQYFSSSTPVLLEAGCGYRYEVATGAVEALNDWTALGVDLGALDALDILWDGSIAFSTESRRHVLQDGSMYSVRHENVYRYDPATGKIGLLLDGEALGLSALDALDVLESGRVVVSTPANQFVLTPSGGMLLRQENAYLVRDGGNFELVFDGEALNVRTLDAIDLDLSMLAIDGDLLHWSAKTTSSGSYDLVRGDLFELFRTGGDFAASTLECLAAGQAEKSVLYPQEPDPGEGFWFVVRDTGGTWDVDGPTQIGSRDAEISASGAGCP